MPHPGPFLPTPRLCLLTVYTLYKTIFDYLGNHKLDCRKDQAARQAICCSCVHIILNATQAVCVCVEGIFVV